MNYPSVVLSFSFLIAFSSDAEIVGHLLQDEDKYMNNAAGSVGGLIGLVQSRAVLNRVSGEGVDSVQHSSTKDTRFRNKL